jgi:hypothetical protein
MIGRSGVVDPVGATAAEGNSAPGDQLLYWGGESASTSEQVNKRGRPGSGYPWGRGNAAASLLAKAPASHMGAVLGSATAQSTPTW